MLNDAKAEALLSEHRDYEAARDKVWLERIRVGLEYRQAMRAVDDRVSAVRRRRDDAIRKTVAAGASYREVARAIGLSHSRIQQIVNAGREGGPEAGGRKPR